MNMQFTLKYFGDSGHWRVIGSGDGYWTAKSVSEIPEAVLGMLRREADELDAYHAAEVRSVSLQK